MFPGVATRNDHYLALARAVRGRILHRWIRSARTYLEEQHRTVIYLSAEYLRGPQLGNNLFTLGIEGPARQAMESLGLNLDELIEHEEEPGLGNGGSASSTRRSATAGSGSARTAGSGSAIRGRSAGSRSSTLSASADEPRPP